MSTLLNVQVWVDGACSGNPGPGAYAAVLQYTKRDGSLHQRELVGTAAHTTNNRMELGAVLAAMQALTLPCSVTVHTDSQLVEGWLSKGWKRNDAECKLLCQLIEKAVADGGHTVAYQWHKGHAGVPLNERCNELAQAAAQEAKRQAA